MAPVETGSLAQARDAFERRDWQRAFELLTAADAEERLGPEDLERLGEAARWSRHFDAVLDAFERAAAGWERAGDRRGIARVALKLVMEHQMRGNEAVGSGWFRRAARALEGEGECPEQGMLLWSQAQGCYEQGDTETGRRLCERAADLGRRLGHRDLEALGLLEQGHGLLVEGAVSEGVELIDEAMAAAMGGELEPWTTGFVYCSTIFACRNRGDWRRAGEWSEVSLRWCERNSLSGFPGLCRFHRAEVMRFRGDLERAERDAIDAIEEMLPAVPGLAAWGFHELGEIRRRRGNRAGAAEAFRRSSELGFDPQPGLALLRLEEGRPDAARRAIVEALADPDATAQESRWLLLPAAAAVGLAANDLELARSSRDELESLAEALGTEAVRAAADVAGGRVALAEGRPEDAAQALRRGRRGWSSVGAPYETAEARMLLAQAYRQLGDADAARDELDGARATFERIGAARAEPVSTPVARTFMFTDIVGSTKLVEALGDEPWESLLAWHDRTLRTCFAEQSGEEVKHEGDGFFVAFSDPACALECACSIQRALREHRREHGFAPPVRIGVHTAHATDRGGDYGGRGVHAAARIAATAGANEIVASRDALEAAGDAFSGRDERKLELKGLAEPVAVSTVDWSGRAGA
jgi:class 3 adenylate cyclase